MKVFKLQILIMVMSLGVISHATKLQFVRSYQWNAITAIEVRDTLLYCAMDEGLQIFNISDPLHQKIIGQGVYDDDVSEYTSVNQFKIAGSYAYASRYNGGLIVMDISNSARPSKVLRINGLIYSVGASKDIACFAVAGYTSSMSNYNFAGIGIIRFDGQEKPAIAGELKIVGSIDDIYINGKYAFLAVNEKGFYLRKFSKLKGELKIIDLADPSTPREIGHLSLDEPIGAITSDKGKAYIITGTTGLVVIDISNPAKPKIIAKQSFKYDGRYPQIKVQGKYVYLSSSVGEYGIFDISDPREPKRINIQKSEIKYERFAISDSLIFACTTDPPITILDIRHPDNIQKIGEIGAVNQFEDMAIDDNYAYLTDLKKGLKVVDINASPGNEIISELDIKKYDRGRLVKYDNYLYMTNWDILLIIDITDPQKPTMIGNQSLGYHMGSFCKYNNYILASSDNCDLCHFSILDLSKPQQPENIKTLLLGRDSFGGIVANDNFLYACSHSTGLKIYGINDMANPQYISSYDTESAESVALKDKVAFIADYAQGIIALDVSNPESITYISSLKPEKYVNTFYSGQPPEIKIKNNYLYWLIPHACKFNIVDISDPESMRLGDTYANLSEPLHFSMDDRYVYVVCKQSLQVLELVK